MSYTAIEGILEDVVARNVNTQYGEKTVYDIKLVNGPKLTAWKKEYAEKAWNLKGRNTVFSVEISQNGEHTNYTVKEVGEQVGMAEHTQFPAMMGGTIASMGMGTAPTATSGGNVTFTPVTTGGNVLPTPSPTIDKDTSIHRQVAAKVASQISTTSNEFWTNVADLFAYFQTGTMPNAGGNSAPNQGIEEPPPTDDIPF